MTWRYRPEDFDCGIVTGVETGQYEERIRVRPGDVVVDGGANIGWFTKQIVDIAKRVYCFEPNPANAELLRENVEPYNHVHVKELALWDAWEEADFYVHYKHPGAGGLYNFGSWRTQKIVRVLTVRLDDCDIRPDFVKLDIEKAELRALAGAQRTLIESRPVIVMEAHPPAGETDERHTREACVTWWRDLAALLPPKYIAVNSPEAKDAWQARIAVFVPEERKGELR